MKKVVLTNSEIYFNLLININENMTINNSIKIIFKCSLDNNFNKFKNFFKKEKKFFNFRRRLK